MVPVHRSLVADVPMFAGMAEAEQDEVLTLARSQHFGAGSAVFEQGEVAEFFYVLLSGRLRVTQTNTEGQQTVVRMVNPGDLFGIARALQRPTIPVRQQRSPTALPCNGR